MDLEQATTSSLRTSLESVSIPSDSPRAGFSNWAKTFHCKPERVFAPTTVEQCKSIVELARREGARLHPVGVGHSPSDLACTNGWLMRMEGLKGMIQVSHPSHPLHLNKLIVRLIKRNEQRPFTPAPSCTMSIPLFKHVSHLSPCQISDRSRIKRSVVSSRQHRTAQASSFQCYQNMFDPWPLSFPFLARRSFEYLPLRTQSFSRRVSAGLVRQA